MTVISTLNNKRGSEGMGLPDKLSSETIEIVANTAAVVAPLSLSITKTFYTNMFGQHKELLAFFNPAHNVPVSLHQPKALAGSIVAYATHIKDLSPLLVPGGPVMAIAHRHCALSVFPAQYQVVHDNVMKAIAQTMGPVITEEIAKAWSEAVLFLAKALIDTEEMLYQMVEQREGGWSGPIDFVVVEIRDVGQDVKAIVFKPVKHSPLEGRRFAFSPGQYLSLTIDVDGDGLTAPRHYTVTSPPGAEYLECSIKKLKGGKISTYVHENLRVGDTVKLTAPYGVFTVEDSSTIDSAVLMSAGIGITPTLNITRALGEKVKLHVHVDHDSECHAYRDDEAFHVVQNTWNVYTVENDGKRMDPEELVKVAVEKVGPDHTFFLCGPEDWMNGVQRALLAKGAKEVKCEVFGSQLATACPFSAQGSTETTEKKSSRCPFH